ncbi:hypothetical protein ACQHMR_21645, partial [Escherichia coli]|uniref:hypothetical protein n=1 Tax=Escherichia coli TaxID=562 RepID=UPI003CEF06BE
VKRRSADGSVGSPHARVGNCQASDKAKGHPEGWPFCAGAEKSPDATLERLIRPTQGYGRGQQRIIPPHTPDSATDTVTSIYPLPYVLLTRNLF